MARVPYLNQSDLPPEHQDILARPIALNRAMANNPNAARAMTHLAMYIRGKSKLDPRLRELAILQVGYLARSPYEYSHHVKIGREFGVADDIRAIGEETAGRATKLDILSRTVLRAAQDDQTIWLSSDETFATLEKALGRENVIDLALAIAFYNGVVRMLGRCRSMSSRNTRRYLERHAAARQHSGLRVGCAEARYSCATAGTRRSGLAS